MKRAAFSENHGAASAHAEGASLRRSGAVVVLRDAASHAHGAPALEEHAVDVPPDPGALTG